MVSTGPLISKSSNHSVTVPSAPITIGIIVTFLFHNFFNSLARSWYLSFYPSFRFLSILRCSQQSPQFGKFYSFFIFYFLFFCCWLLLGLVVWPRLGDLFISQNNRGVCVFSFSKTDARLYIYYLFVWSNLNFLHNSQWITLPTQLCLVWHSFCDNYYHSLWVFHTSFC